jgi:hypothetical protein
MPPKYPKRTCLDAAESAQNAAKAPKSTWSDAGESAQNVIFDGGIIGLSVSTPCWRTDL